MRQGSLKILLLALLIGMPAASRADVVFLKHGAKLEGRIVERTDSSLRIDIGAGTLTLPMSNVDRIEEGRTPLDDFDERAGELDASDRDGWLELAQWASDQGLGQQSVQAYRRVFELDPSHPEANRALGRVNVEGRWMTEDEAYRARGYVRFEGRWMTPAEQDSILRTREADRVAEAEALKAEGQAWEAEARAKEAETRARRSSWTTYPLHWGTWGPGPSNWPTNPLDRPGMFESTRSQGQP
jgi:hypothetical protein